MTTTPMSDLDFPMDKLTPEARAVNLARMRDYLRRLAPSLKLTEPDSYAFKHYYEHGHALQPGCCRHSRAGVEAERVHEAPQGTGAQDEVATDDEHVTAPVGLSQAR